MGGEKELVTVGGGGGEKEEDAEVALGCCRPATGFVEEDRLHM